MNRTVTFLMIFLALLIMGQRASAQQYDVSFKSFAGKFVVAENGGGGAVKANRDEIGPWEKFTIIRFAGQGDIRNGDTIVLQANNDHYVVAENVGDGVVNANRKEIGPWEKFTIIVNDKNRQ